MIEKFINLLKIGFFLLQNKHSTIRTLNIHKTVKIGEYCFIKKGVGIGENVIIQKGVKIYENVLVGKKTFIGEYTSINRNTIIDYAHIGNFNSIGPNCHIGAGDHAVDFISTSQFVYGKENVFNVEPTFASFHSPAILENDIWIGSNVVIMQGIRVGSGSLIGSNAVVTKDVPAYHVVAGVPAKILRKRFNDETIKYLNERNLFSDYELNKDLIHFMASKGDKWIKEI